MKERALDRLSPLRLTLILLTIISLFAVRAATAAHHEKTSADEVKTEMSEAADALGNYSVEQKDAAMAHAKAKIDELNTKIDAYEEKMKGKWGETKTATSENYDKSIAALKEQRDSLVQWYDKMHDASPEAWEEVQKGFSDSYSALKESFGKAMDAYK